MPLMGYAVIVAAPSDPATAPHGSSASSGWIGLPGAIAPLDAANDRAAADRLRSVLPWVRSTCAGRPPPSLKLCASSSAKRGWWSWAWATRVVTGDRYWSSHSRVHIEWQPRADRGHWTEPPGI